MGDIRPQAPVLLILAAFSRYEGALAWARGRAEQTWGRIALTSPLYEFVETRFYEATMGPGIRKVFWGFDALADAAALADWKQQTNAWEDAYRDSYPAAEPRPLNLDPGYLTEAKLVLATTKDRDHRIYVRDGIFAEVTLAFQDHQWRPRPWTYPDYCRADYHQFFLRCRDFLRQRYGKAGRRAREA